MSGTAPVRAATAADADAIARHRIALFRAVLPEARWPEADALLGASRDAVAETLADGTALAWLAATPGEEPVGSLVMHLVRRLPSPTSPSGREGYIVHAFVADAHRGAGVGAALLAAAEAEARVRGLGRIRLHSADRAVEFYLRAGFTLRTNDMERLLR